MVLCEDSAAMTTRFVRMTTRWIRELRAETDIEQGLSSREQPTKLPLAVLLGKDDTAAQMFAAILLQAITDRAEYIDVHYLENRLEYVIDGKAYDMCSPPLPVTIDIVRGVAEGAGVTETGECGVWPRGPIEGIESINVCRLVDERGERLRLSLNLTES